MLRSRDGDLRVDGSTPSSVLHRFSLPGTSKAGVPFSLATKLDLGVGGNGIIGRRVSLLAGHVVLAEGILGWN